MQKTALLALSLASLLALSPDGAGAARSKKDRGQTRRETVLRGIYGEVLGPASVPDRTLGGSFNNPFGGATGTATPLPRGVYEITLKKTGTDWDETFLVGIPKQMQTPAPVLVLFHGYGQTPRKLLDLTTYFPDAMARGWIVVAPLSAHVYNFSIDYAQQNTEKALDWVAKYFPVDPERFYAVGFSMGGGAAATYAARHLDAKHARFAAVVNHTGTTSVADVYWSADDDSLLSDALMFGGSPAEVPFRYSTASMMDLDTFTDQIDPTTDLARNLRHIPVKNFCAANDPNTYLVHQTERSFDQLSFRDVPTEISQSAHNVHKWSTLGETSVLNFLEPLVLAEPAPGTPVRTLADHDGTWFDFGVKQLQAGQFSPFRWTVMTNLNRLYLDEVSNVQRITVDPAKLDLNKTAALEVVFNNVDGNTVEIALAGYPQPPTDVLRGGQSTGSWTYDAVTGTVVLIESGGQNYPTWRIVP